MISGNSMSFDVFLKFDSSDFKKGQWSFQMSYKQFPSMSISDDHDVSIVESSSIMINLIKFHFISWIKINIMKDHHELSDHVINFSGRFNLCRYKNFNRNGIIQYRIKLIQLFLLIFINKFFIGKLFILNSLWLFSLLLWQFLSLLSLFHFELILNYFSLCMNFHSFLFVFNVMSLYFYAVLEL